MRNILNDTFRNNIFFEYLPFKFSVQEVRKKSERIAVLEHDKASLIRELIQMRSQNNRNSGQEEAVF